MVGIEPTLWNQNWILSPTRLPIPPHSHYIYGGERRIWTFEAVGGGFTIRRIWPLSNLPRENLITKQVFRNKFVAEL